MHILVTRRLTMRPPLEVDLEAIAAAIGDWEVSRWLGTVPHPYTLNDASHWYENMERGPGDRRWTLHDVTGFCGVVSLRMHADGADGPELGYWLARARWGQGLMSEAVRGVLVDHFHRDGGSVMSGAQEANVASLRVQSKMGFEPAGTLRRASQALGQDVTILRTRLERRAFEQRFPRKDMAA